MKLWGGGVCITLVGTRPWFLWVSHTSFVLVRDNSGRSKFTFESKLFKDLISVKSQDCQKNNYFFVSQRISFFPQTMLVWPSARQVFHLHQSSPCFRCRFFISPHVSDAVSLSVFMFPMPFLYQSSPCFRCSFFISLHVSDAVDFRQRGINS